jgi:hypothetical protein
MQQMQIKKKFRFVISRFGIAGELVIEVSLWYHI